MTCLCVWMAAINIKIFLSHYVVSLLSRKDASRYITLHSKHQKFSFTFLMLEVFSWRFCIHFGSCRSLCELCHSRLESSTIVIQCFSSTFFDSLMNFRVSYVLIQLFSLMSAVAFDQKLFYHLLSA